MTSRVREQDIKINTIMHLGISNPKATKWKSKQKIKVFYSASLAKKAWICKSTPQYTKRKEEIIWILDCRKRKKSKLKAVWGKKGSLFWCSKTLNFFLGTFVFRQTGFASFYIVSKTLFTWSHYGNKWACIPMENKTFPKLLSLIKMLFCSEIQA